MDAGSATLALIVLAVTVSLGAHIVVHRAAQRLFGTDMAQVLSNGASLLAALVVFLAASLLLGPSSAPAYALVLLLVLALTPAALVDNVRIRVVRDETPSRQADGRAKTA